MITDLPIYVYLTFGLALIYVLVLFYFASNKNNKFLIGIILWAILQSVLAIMGFHDNSMTTPPRFTIILFPMFAIVLSSLFSKKMKNWLTSFNLKLLTYLHTVRVLVELVLLWLFIGSYAPELMTFEGRNFDIIAGITAPAVAYFAFRNNQVNKKLLWTWNIASLMLLMFILVNAVFSMPTILQVFAFDQPAVGVMKFPFILLPVVIVPLVLLSHVASFVILSRDKRIN